MSLVLLLVLVGQTDRPLTLTEIWPGRILMLNDRTGPASVPVCEPRDFEDFSKAYESGDGVALDLLRKKGLVWDEPNRTRVLVIESKDFYRPVPAIEVRILDGPRREKVCYCRLGQLSAPFDPAPPPRPARSRKKPASLKGITGHPVNLAASRLAQARALEASNRRGAIAYYRQLLKDFPGTPQAKVAAERIKALSR